MGIGIGISPVLGVSAGTPAAPGTPVITSGALPSMRVGEFVTHTYTATGDPTITWSVSAGALQDGLSLDTNTGVLSGIPEYSGYIEWQVMASNGAGSDTQDHAPTIAGHRSVRFHHDYMTLAGTGLTAVSSGTERFFACKINMEALPDSGTEWYLFNHGRGITGGQIQFKVSITSDGGVKVNALDSSGGDPKFQYLFDTRLSASTDYVLHISLDSADTASSQGFTTSVTDTATFASDVYGDSTDTLITDNSGAYREGFDFVVTQQSPTILTRNSPDLWDTDISATRVGNLVRLWVNGTQFRLAQVLLESIGDGVFTVGGTDAHKRCVIGTQHDAVTTPTYSASEILGEKSGGDVGVNISFLIFDDVKNNDAFSVFESTTVDRSLHEFASSGATPALIFFGGTQAAADWNAGTNQGSGENFTMVGTVA
jgi:hypothetical protein